MGLWNKIRELFGAQEEDDDLFADPETFIYIRIPEDIGPMDRGEKYEDPLLEALEAAGLGEVTGGGSQLGDERPDGTRPIEFCGIDVDLVPGNLDAVRALLRETLVRLGAPVGTEVQFTRDERRLQDVLTDDGWQLEQPRELGHPAFGV